MWHDGRLASVKHVIGIELFPKVVDEMVVFMFFGKVKSRIALCCFAVETYLFR